MNSRINIQRSTVNIYAWLNLQRLRSSYPRNPDATKRLQLKKLRRLLICAFEKHKFYKERMENSGLNPYRLADLEELQKLPPLTKEEYRAFTQELLERYPEKYRSWYFDQTSGSTGTPLEIVRSWPERGYMLAKWLRAVYMNGYHCTDHTFRIMAPHRITGKMDTCLQSLGLFRFSQISYFATGKEMAEAYQRIQPDFFYANRTQLEVMTQYILETGMNITRPKIYSTGAEIITQASRNLFGSVLGKDNFFENYGCEEMGILAFQLKGVEGLNFCHDTNILELLSPDGSVSEEKGEVLITDLGIRNFPIIRYRLGDSMDTFMGDTGIQKIKSIQGRTEDWLFWKDGSRTSSIHFYEIMGRYSTHISRFKIIQESWALIRILVIPTPGLNRDREKQKLREDIIRNMQEEMSREITFLVVYVHSIPPDKNGKMGIISSKIDKTEWQKKVKELQETAWQQVKVNHQ